MKQPLRIASLMLAVTGALLMGGCSTIVGIFSTTPEITPTAPRAAASPVAGGFDWDWDVRGDQAVRPIQVFSDGNKTWLQFGQRQFMPAVIVNGAPVPFDVAPPYLIVQGQPGRIDLMVAGYRATAVKRVQPVPAAWTHSGGAKVTSETLPPGVAYFPMQALAAAVPVSASPATAYPVAAGYPPSQAGNSSAPTAASTARIQRIPSSEIPSQ
jgi:hypothetical protein